MSSPPIHRIPLASPNIGPREIELVVDVLTSTVLAMGPYTGEFEERIAGLASRRHAIACSSGTAGLHLAVRALGLRPGDEVVTTPFSFVASANCLLFEGVVPRFVDIENETLGLDPALVAETRGDRVRGLLPVHVFGRPCRIDALDRIASDRAWSMIEDSCEGLGSRVGDRPLGSFGDASVFAFYPNKQITTGEGGVVVTDSDELAATMRSLRNQGRDVDSTWLRHVRLGFNYRLDEMSAAVGVAQLERLAELQAGRARVEAAYRAALGNREWLTLPTATANETVDWFVYVVRLHASIDRGRLIGQLDEAGIQTRPYFSPLHLQPIYRQQFGYQPGDFPVTERVAASTLALPFSSLLSDEDVAYVSDRLVAAVAAQRD